MKTFKIIASVLVIIVALAWLQRAIRSKPLDAEALPPTGMGQVLAEEAAKALPKGGQVVLVSMSGGTAEDQAKLEGFNRTLGKQGKIKVIATKEFKLNEVGMGDGRIKFEQFAAVVNEHSNADVIVSFLGVNSFTEAQMASLPKPCPQFVVANWKPEDVRRGMNAGLVKAAVMNRVLRSLPTDDPKTPIQWFDRYYDLVTPDLNRRP